MEYYEKEIAETLEDIVNDGHETREDVLKRWADGDTQDDFGNMTGSRFCNAYKAQEALKESGVPFDEELNELLESNGYDLSILDRGAEVVDVIFCELIAPIYASEQLDNLRET